MHRTFLFIPLLSITCHLATAWSGLGHCTVGYLAETFFTDAASSMVNDLLRNDDGDDICDVATWADKVKFTHAFEGTDVWHFIDAADDPPNHCGIDFDQDCNRGKTPGCLVSAITAMTDQIQGDDSEKRTEALKFLIHLIGDAHQPLHTENISRGGNDIFICFYDKCGSDSRRMELHAIWDAEIPDKHRGVADSSKWAVLKNAGKKWADELASSTMVQDLLANVGAECLDIGKAQECSLVWAGEANAKVCEFVLKDYPFQETSLGDEYFEGAVPVVDEMITKAGFRLGKWINALAEVGRNEKVKLVGQSGDGEL